MLDPATSSADCLIAAGLLLAEFVSLPTLLAGAGTTAATVILLCGADSTSGSCAFSQPARISTIQNIDLNIFI
jgi:hypothetical protein